MLKNYPVKIGDKVYYSIEDYNTGTEIIYEGAISKIYDTTIKIKDKDLTMTLYQVADGLSMQRNAFYTLPELFDLKSRLEYLHNNLQDRLTPDLKVIFDPQLIDEFIDNTKEE